MTATRWRTWLRIASKYQQQAPTDEQNTSLPSPFKAAPLLQHELNSAATTSWRICSSSSYLQLAYRPTIPGNCCNSLLPHPALRLQSSFTPS